MAQRKRDQRKRAAELRQRAASKLRGRPTSQTGSVETRELAQVIGFIRSELEMQNRELCGGPTGAGRDPRPVRRPL